MMGSALIIIPAIFTSLIGIICLGAGIIGYLIAEARSYERILLLLGAFMLIKPGLATDLAGLACVGLTIVIQLRKVRALRP